MDDMLQVIKGYVEIKKPNYAIQINGAWGIGKTYFVLNTVKPVVEQMNVPNSAEDSSRGIKEKYRFVYVSLNGIKDVEEIGENIFLASVSRWKSLPYSIIKTGLKYGKGAIEKYLGTEVAAEELVEGAQSLLTNMENCVLCFDDLERIDKSLNIQQVLGYINTNYIEHHHIRTLIVSNEDKLLHSKEFIDIREKVIGRTIKFQKSIKDIIPIFVENNYDSDSFISKFIIKNSSLVYEILISITPEFNLRTLQFVFDNFDHVVKQYDETLSINEEDENFKITLSIFLNVLLLSVEYKNGEIAKVDDIEFIYNQQFKYLKRKSVVEKPKSYEEQFKERYLNNKPLIKDNVLFYREIGLFILEGILNVEKFVNEIHEMNFKKTDSREIAMQNVYSYQELEFDELLSNIEILLAGVKEGYYLPPIYPSLFEHLYAFIEKGYREWNEEELYEHFQLGLLESLKTHKLNNLQEVQITTSLDGANTNNNYNKMVRLINETRQQQMEKGEQSTVTEFLEALKSVDIRKISIAYQEVRYKNELFSLIDLEDFSTEIFSWSNKSISTFISFLNEKYLRTSNAKELYASEVPYLKNLIKLINDKKSEHEQTIDLLKMEVISTLLERLKKTKEHLS